MSRHNGQGRKSGRGFGLRPLSLGVFLCGAAAPTAIADRIENGVAVFAALDKVTARISKLEVPLNQTVRFGSLKVTPRSCFSRPPTEPPKTTTFVEVDETLLEGQEKRLFTGWMFAESPGLNAVEHPVFDVWLTQCTQPATTAKAARDALAGQAHSPEPVELPRRRVRR
jgi:hypothetical protein